MVVKELKHGHLSQTKFEFSSIQCHVTSGHCTSSAPHVSNVVTYGAEITDDTKQQITSLAHELIKSL